MSQSGVQRYCKRRTCYSGKSSLLNVSGLQRIVTEGTPGFMTWIPEAQHPRAYEIEWLTERQVYSCVFDVEFAIARGILAGCITERSVPITREDSFCFANSIGHTPVPVRHPAPIEVFALLQWER